MPAYDDFSDRVAVSKTRSAQINSTFLGNMRWLMFSGGDLVIDSTVHTNAPEVVDVLMAAFPEYKGRTVRLRPLRFPFRLDSYWDGGSRSYYRFVNLAGDEKAASESEKSETQVVSVLKPWATALRRKNSLVIGGQPGYD